MNNANTHMPQNLFDALARYDLEGMVCLYAFHTRNAIQSVASVNKDIKYRSLWKLRPDNSKENNQFEDNLTRVIQELDEIVSSSNRTNVTAADMSNSNSTTVNNNHADGTNVASFRARPFELNQNRGTNSNNNLLPFFPTLLDEPRFMPSPVPSSNESNTNTNTTPNTVQRSLLRRMRSHLPSNSNNTPMETTEADDMSIHEQEVEYCINNRLRTLTNARPFPTLVVYKDGKIPSAPHQIEPSTLWPSLEHLTGINIEYHTRVSLRETEDVPIFDGAVANATPPGTQGIGGGSGTILHLACALDSPFALVLLLLMGGNASCRHTAFRRSVVHEAACSDSPRCLKLLLDLGNFYHADYKKENDANRMDVDVTMNPGVDANLNSSTGGGGDAPTENANQERKQHFKNIPTKPSNTCVALGVASLLRSALSLIRQIQSGEIDDLEAAERLLTLYPMSRANQRFLAVSCFAGSDDMNITDGHGNTALHWAAFKNALGCASILLANNTNPNAVATNSGWTPLHDAAYSDSTETLALLLSHGANVNVRAYSGASPLCFAAQEDAPNATRLLLNAGADATVRCCDDRRNKNRPGGILNHQPNRFSGYTPLHYCAHYNAHNAVREILEHHNRIMEPNNETLLEIPDLNDKLPIHVAVARGSSDVLRDLLHYGARVETGRARSCSMSYQNDDQSNSSIASVASAESPIVSHHSASFNSSDNDVASIPQAANVDTYMMGDSSGDEASPSPHGIVPRGTVITPVSSPILRSMIPSEPVDSPKPWNCISQRSIDECRTLIEEAESNWTPERHSIFHPSDRLAVIELLRVGKRLEQSGTGIFIDLWPLVLSFCGRGWFEPERSTHHYHGSIYFPQDL